MHRRHFLATGLGGIVAATAAGAAAGDRPAGGGAQPEGERLAADPAGVKLCVKPVMTNILHTDTWEGPCRWSRVTVDQEKTGAQRSFAAWAKQLREKGLGRPEDVRLLEPAHVTFSEKFVLAKAELDRIARDAPQTDAFFIYPSGSSVAAFEIGDKFKKPILLMGLGCRNVDIAAYTRSKGNEALVAADNEELAGMLSLLRARKVFTQTRVLFPTDRGLPASCSVGSIWCLKGLKEKLGVDVKLIPYKELADEMDRVLADQPGAEKARQAAESLLAKADKSYIDKKYVMRSLQFHRAVESLMARHGCNAFTIECFELCASRLAEKWTITPCLVHALMRNVQRASSCEGDLGSLLAMRMLMSVSGKSCHQGNSDPRPGDTFRINHSAPSMKMNGFDRPDLPYQLGRFVESRWGTKVVIDFMNNPEKTVTVARINPLADKLLVLRGKLVGASGWNQDLIGCSVEAVIKPPEGRTAEFLKRRLEYGNHLQWAYGDYAEPMRELGEMLKLQVEVIA